MISPLLSRYVRLLWTILFVGFIVPDFRHRPSPRFAEGSRKNCCYDAFGSRFRLRGESRNRSHFASSALTVHLCLLLLVFVPFETRPKKLWLSAPLPFLPLSLSFFFSAPNSRHKFLDEGRRHKRFVAKRLFTSPLHLSN